MFPETEHLQIIYERTGWMFCSLAKCRQKKSEPSNLRGFLTLIGVAPNLPLALLMWGTQVQQHQQLCQLPVKTSIQFLGWQQLTFICLSTLLSCDISKLAATTLFFLFQKNKTT